MVRIIGMAGAILASLLFLVPVAAAAEPYAGSGRVVVSTQGDVTIPAGEQADAVVVVNGTARIAGEVTTVVVVDGRIELMGARAETVVSVRSPVEVGPGSVVSGDVLTLDAIVRRVGDAEVQGEVRDIAVALVGVSAVLVPALILLWVGFALATFVAALLLAALAARQVRDAEAIISREPLPAFLVGLLGVIAIPALAIVLMVTVVGAPLGFALLAGVLPALAFVGYLVAAIWVGDWVLRRSEPERVRTRPFLAALIGVVLLGLVGLVPVLNIVSAIASLVGFGAVLILAWRTVRGPGVAPQPLPGPVAAPLAG